MVETNVRVLTGCCACIFFRLCIGIDGIDFWFEGHERVGYFAALLVGEHRFWFFDQVHGERLLCKKTVLMLCCNCYCGLGWFLI